MEFWDLYTENRERTGEIQIRGEQIPDGAFHLVVHVWIKNSKGEYLISRRSAARQSFPLMYECVGGSVLQGEDSLHGAIRETEEEVGVRLHAENGKLLFSEVRRHFQDILDVCLFSYNGEIDLSRATTDEVSESGWRTREQIRNLYERKEFVETLGYFFEKVDGCAL